MEIASFVIDVKFEVYVKKWGRKISVCCFCYIF